MNNRVLNQELQIYKEQRVSLTLILIRQTINGFVDELIKQLKMKQDQLNMNETIEERVSNIKRYIEGLEDPNTEMVSMNVDNSKTPHFFLIP